MRVLPFLNGVKYPLRVLQREQEFSGQDRVPGEELIQSSEEIRGDGLRISSGYSFFEKPEQPIHV